MINIHILNSEKEKKLVNAIENNTFADTLASYLDKGYSIDARFNNRDTILHRIIQSTVSNQIKLQYVKLILNADANPNIKGCKGWTPLHCAAINPENLEIVKELLNMNADPSLTNYENKIPAELIDLEFTRPCTDGGDAFLKFSQMKNLLIQNQNELSVENKRKGFRF